MSHLTYFRALCFDVYGTLIDWETGVLTGLEPLLSSNKVSFPRQHVLEIYHELERAQQARQPDVQYADILKAIHPQIAERLGLPAPSDGENIAFGQTVGSWPAFADTVDALCRLGKVYKLVVLSNVDLESFRRTNEGSLKDVNFDLIITAQDVGSYKPDLRNFETMLQQVREHFGIDQHQILQTAQSQFHDHQPASKVGIKSSWIVRPGSVMGNRSDAIYDWKFDTLGDMANAVDAELLVTR